MHVCFLYVDVFSSLLLIIHYHSIDKAYSLVVIVFLCTCVCVCVCAQFYIHGGQRSTCELGSLTLSYTFGKLWVPQALPLFPELSCRPSLQLLKAPQVVPACYQKWTVLAESE